MLLLLFRYFLIFLYAVIALFIVGCFNSSTTISGKIVAINTQHSYPGDFNFTPDSHAIIEIRVEESSESNRLIFTHKINNITQFPISFSINLTPPIKISRDNEYRISVKVISGKDDQTQVGDFISESVTYIPQSGHVMVEVSGLESCEASLGGYCK